MVSRMILSLLFILFAFSCKEENTELVIPAGILPQDKMAAVFSDLSIMEASINVSKFNPDRAASDSLRFNVYKQQNISRSAYDSSVAFYSKHPDEFRKIYKMVEEKIAKLQ
jgi:hypothetical protein